MGSIVKIARKEWREMRRDKRLHGTSAIILLLLLTALGSGGIYQNQRHRQQEQEQRLGRAQWLTQAAKDPHFATHYGAYVVQPAGALSFLDPGVEPFTGAGLSLEAHKQNDANFRPIRDASTLQRFGSLTATLLLQVVVPLWIFLLLFGSFAGERDAGTLRMMLSIGVSPRQIALGKALGAVGALGIVLVPAVLLGSLAVCSTSADSRSIDTLLRLLLLMGGYLLYFGIFIGIALGVSAAAPTARTALSVLLGFWVFSTALAPRLAGELAKRLYPTPSMQQYLQDFEEDKQHSTGGIATLADKQALDAQLMKQFKVSRIADLPVNTRGIALQKNEDHGNELWDRHRFRLWNTFARQQAVYDGLACLAPTLAIRSLSMGLAGTDEAAQLRFAQRGEEYRRVLVKTMNDDLTYHSGSRPDYRADTAVWARVPAFEYRAAGVGATVSALRPPIVILIGWLLISLSSVYAVTRRMRAA